MDGIVTYVLSGGIGARLAPYSTPAMPKQYLALVNGVSTLGSTIDRMTCGLDAAVHIVAALDDLPHLKPYRDRLGKGGRILLEPVRCNTAMAVAVATVHALEQHGDRPILVTPSDHQVESAAAFRLAVQKGFQPADDGRLVLIGIMPTRPDTGFGYIEVPPDGEESAVTDVRRFHEKPDLVTARSYLASGRHFWNSGVLLYRPSTVRDLFLAWSPQTWTAAEEALSGATRDDGCIRLDGGAYAKAPSSQFDRMIVERAPRVSMVRGDFRWRDLGTWRSIVEATVDPWRAAQ
jgi:mannose-1-phosphate guanylyltransferase